MGGSGGYIGRVGRTWEVGAEGVLVLPSGRCVRGRALRKPIPPGPTPQFAVHLLGRAPAPVAWQSRWVRWPDFLLPLDRNAARAALTEAWDRAQVERVEVACAGGRGRTGTALACLCVLEGMGADQAVAFVRAHYHRHAVETPWQHRWVRRFARG